MKNRKGLLVTAVLLILALIVFINRGRIHFDWGMFFQQLRHIAWIHIAIGIAPHLRYLRLCAPYRWSIFLSPTTKVSGSLFILGPQFEKNLPQSPSSACLAGSPHPAPRSSPSASSLPISTPR